MSAPVTPAMQAEAEATWAERDRRIASLHARHLEALRLSLPVDDPDRHDLDPLDDAFAHLAPGYPDSSSPADFAASVAAGFVSPPVWDDCEPAFAPARDVEDVQTGGRL